MAHFRQALFSPIAGVLAVRYNRAQLVGFGTIFWAVSTAGVGLSRTYWECAVWRALTGIGLSIVVPAIQSFVADSCAVESRGVAFGWLNLTGSAGSIIGSMSATILAGQSSILGLPGWRFSFCGMAVLSIGIGLAVYFFVVDPRDTKSLPGGSHPTSSIRRPSGGRQMRESWRIVKSVLSIPTFQIIVLQGLVGSIPWQAMVFFTLWLQLVGFSHKSSAYLMGVFSAGCAFGALLGGWLGDRLSKMFPDSGRIMCAQLSAFLGVPFSFVLLILLPQDSSWFLAYAATFLLGGLTISWCQAATNNPIFAEIVPEDLRTTVYAFDRAFEGAIAALAAPAVGILAEKWFGSSASVDLPVGGSVVEARALSRGLISCMAVPFAVCSLCYGLLYATYSQDRDTVFARTR